MPRYKVHLPAKGEYLRGEGYDEYAFVADTADEARAMFEDFFGERPEWVHSYIARGRAVYKRDWEAGDCHEDAEPGDTTFDYLPDTGRELGANDVRVWERGVPRMSGWMIRPQQLPPVQAEQIPVGATLWHPRLHSGQIVGAPQRISPGRVVVDVQFAKARKTCSVAVLHINEFRAPVSELVIGDELIGSGTREEMYELLKAKEAEWAEQWKAAQSQQEPSHA